MTASDRATDDEYDCHIVPLGDLKEHVERRSCWCEPQLLVDDCGDALIVHNSMDRREHTIEKGIVQ